MQPHLYLLRQDVQGQSLLINKECDHRSATICSQVFPPQFLLLQSLLIAGFCMENYTSKKAPISERPPTQPLEHPPPPVKCRCFSSRLQSRKNPHLDLLWHDILGQSLTEMHSDPWLDRPITPDHRALKTCRSHKPPWQQRWQSNPVPPWKTEVSKVNKVNTRCFYLSTQPEWQLRLHSPPVVFPAFENLMRILGFQWAPSHSYLLEFQSLTDPQWFEKPLKIQKTNELERVQHLTDLTAKTIAAPRFKTQLWNGSFSKWRCIWRSRRSLPGFPKVNSHSCESTRQTRQLLTCTSWVITSSANAFATENVRHGFSTQSASLMKGPVLRSLELRNYIVTFCKFCLEQPPQMQWR